MKRFSLILLLSAGFNQAAAFTLTLNDVPSRVRAHHPSLKAARLAIEEARGRQLGAGRLANPTLGVDWRSESAVSPVTGQFSFDQAFPLTRRLSLEKQLTSQLVAAAELEVRDVERRFVNEARTVAVELLALDQQRALRAQQGELAGKLAEFVKGRADKGELSPLDAAQVQFDAERFVVEGKKLAAQRASLLGRLKPMLGLAPGDSLQLSGSLPALTIPAAGAWDQRSDYQLAQARQHAARTEAELARANRLQDVSVGLVGGPERQAVNESVQRTGFIGFRVSIPLPLWNRNQGEIAEKNATVERQRLEVEALGQQIAGEADTARREMQAHADLARETRDRLLPLAVEQTQNLEKAYQSGQADLLTLLRARDQRLQLEAAALDAVRDFHLARIRYETAIGASLP